MPACTHAAVLSTHQVPCLVPVTEGAAGGPRVGVGAGAAQHKVVPCGRQRMRRAGRLLGNGRRAPLCMQHGEAGGAAAGRPLQCTHSNALILLSTTPSYTYHQRSLQSTLGRVGQGASLAGGVRGAGQQGGAGAAYTQGVVRAGLPTRIGAAQLQGRPAHATPHFHADPPFRHDSVGAPGSGPKGVVVHSQPPHSSWRSAPAAAAPGAAPPAAAALGSAPLDASQLARASSYSASVSRRQPAQRAYACASARL